MKGEAANEVKFSFSGGIVKLLQFVEYFVIAHLWFVETFTDSRRRDVVVRIFGIITAVTLLAALTQSFSKTTPVLGVRGGWFSNRYTYGVYLALARLMVGVVGSYACIDSGAVSESGLVVVSRGNRKAPVVESRLSVKLLHDPSRVSVPKVTAASVVRS